MEINKEKLIDAVVRLQKGDGKAFEDLYNLTYNAARFTALKITKNEQDAEDVLQDSYIKVLEKINTIDKPESFMSWFNMTVANKARDLMRKSKPGLFSDYEKENEDGDSFSVIDTIEEDNPEYIPGEDVEKEELRKDMMKLIEGLSDEKRAAVILFYYNEMSIKDIASALNISEGTVKSRLFNAKKELAVGVEKLKKSGKLLGVAPMSVVSWAIKASSAAAGTTYSGAAAATFTAVTASSAATAAGIGTAAAAGGTAAAGAGVVTKIIAAVVAVAVVGGGVVAGTQAQKNKKEKGEATQTASIETANIETTKSETASADEKEEKSDDRNYVFIDKEDKKVDIEVGTEEFNYGNRGIVERYTVNEDGNIVNYERLSLLDRSKYNASYMELLPAAQSNRAEYDSQIKQTYASVNSVRSGMKKLYLDELLTEQANVRAEEIANSGLNFSIRPDGTDYTTIFEENGYKSGTMLECRVYGATSAENAIESIKKNYADELLNPDVVKIGVGVAKEPQSDTYVYVVHLYSTKGSATNVDNSAKERFLYNLSKSLYSAEGEGYAAEENSEEIFQQIYEIPVIGELEKIDIPIDSLIKMINDSRDMTRKEFYELLNKIF